MKTKGENINILIFMIHGEADRFHSAGGAKKIFERIEVQDKDFINYPVGYYEVHNDLDNQEMVSDLQDWINWHMEDQ